MKTKPIQIATIILGILLIKMSIDSFLLKAKIPEQYFLGTIFLLLGIGVVMIGNPKIMEIYMKNKKF